jgi:hypothetical protein
VSLLRDSFAGINARFHLAGFYTLAALLLSLAQRRLLSLEKLDPEWLGLVLSGVMLLYGTVWGLYGLVFEAATGRTERQSFLHYAAGLFLPLLWLTVKISVLLVLPALVAAAVFQAATGGGAQAERTLDLVFFWGTPLLGIVARILSLYSMPLCILARERGERRSPILEGLGYCREFPRETLRLLSVAMLGIGLGAGLAFARGFERRNEDPGVADGLVLLATSYLELVVFFGATRVLLARPGRARRSLLPAGSNGRPAGPFA